MLLISLFVRLEIAMKIDPMIADDRQEPEHGTVYRQIEGEGLIQPNSMGLEYVSV